jgi:hypothetical protein
MFILFSHYFDADLYVVKQFMMVHDNIDTLVESVKVKDESAIVHLPNDHSYPEYPETNDVEHYSILEIDLGVWVS